VGLNALKSLNLTNVYPNNKKNNNNKVKSKPLELRARVKISREIRENKNKNLTRNSGTWMTTPLPRTALTSGWTRPDGKR
jgi:hypothetical protein